jgi:hypothetical protein
VDQFYNIYDLRNFLIISNFKALKKPAVLFNNEENTLFFLFDLEELVCRLAKLEDEKDLNDHHGRFLAKFCCSDERWKYPLLEIIGQMIRKTFGFSNNIGDPRILITHDVDRIGLEPFYLMRSFLKNPLEIMHWSRISRFKSFPFKNLLDVNEKYNVKPVWFLLSGSYSFRRYGNRYDCHTEILKQLIEYCKMHDNRIGLHTSYYGAFNADKNLKEKKNLEQICKQPIVINRNHYLRFDARKSIPIYEKCNFNADATLGYPDVNGFRAGLCRPFFMWNYQRNKQSCILEYPLLFMDSIHDKNLADSWNDLKRVLYWIKRSGGGGTILFHPYFIEAGKHLAFYEDTIKEINQSNIHLVSLGGN